MSDQEISEAALVGSHALVAGLRAREAEADYQRCLQKAIMVMRRDGWNYKDIGTVFQISRRQARQAARGAQ